MSAFTPAVMPHSAPAVLNFYTLFFNPSLWKYWATPTYSSINPVGGRNMLLEVISRARSRLLWNALAFHFAVAVNVALGVLALLLFLGVDLLDWRWLVVLPSVSLAAGVVIARRRLLAPYPTAQLVDRRLKLADALSTALFFGGIHPTCRCDEDLRRAQHAE